MWYGRLKRHFLITFLAVVLVGCQALLSYASVLPAFEARVKHSFSHLGDIVKAAEAAASRIVKHPKALINVPYAEQQSFAEEMVNRSGGLANALPSADRPKLTTQDDVFLVSLRSWEKDYHGMLPLLRNAREKGWLIILFASKQGAPSDLDVDYLVDNGAESGSDNEAPINAIANVLNGHLWTCEYTAALTRRGKHPGILMSMKMPDAGLHNKMLKSERRRLFPCKTKIGAGKLSEQYFKRVDRLLHDMTASGIQQQIAHAADLIADQLASGNKVLMATCTHILMYEMTRNRRTPVEPFNVVWRADKAFARHVKEDDLVIFFGFEGVSTLVEDYLTPMRRTKAGFITSFVHDDTNPDNNAPEAVAHIAQSWTRPDAEVAIPFPPGRMAAVSGINQGLLWRMLEAAIATRLSGAKGRVF